MSRLDQPFFRLPSLLPLGFGVAVAGKQVTVEAVVEPVEKVVALFLVSKDAREVLVFSVEHLFVAQPFQSARIQGGPAVGILPVKEKLNKDDASKKVVTYIIVR